MAEFKHIPLPERWPVGCVGWIRRFRPFGILLCATASILLIAGGARATTVQYPDHDVFEGVFFRPSGSKITFEWRAASATNRGEWRIYRGRDLGDFEFVDSTPARLGEATYRFEPRRPLIDREYFQLRYCSADGSEAVLATVLLVGTEMSSGIQPLPDGPPAALSTMSPGWEPPDFTSDLKLPAGILQLRDRPEPAVPPPETAG